MTESIEIVKEIDTPKVYLALRKDGIGYLFLKDNTELNIELQTELLKLYDELNNKKLTPFIFEAGEGVTITKEARDNATLIEDISALKASAVVVDNLAYRMIANFYMTFNKPKRPYKVFGKREDAIAWLKQFV